MITPDIGRVRRAGYHAGFRFLGHAPLTQQQHAPSTGVREESNTGPDTGQRFSREKRPDGNELRTPANSTGTEILMLLRKKYFEEMLRPFWGCGVFLADCGIFTQLATRRPRSAHAHVHRPRPGSADFLTFPSSILSLLSSLKT